MSSMPTSQPLNLKATNSLHVSIQIEVLEERKTQIVQHHFEQSEVAEQSLPAQCHASPPPPPDFVPIQQQGWLSSTPPPSSAELSGSLTT